MFEMTILVVSDDNSLIDQVGGIARAIGGLKVAVVADHDLAHTHEPWGQVALVLIHLGPGDATSAVVRMLRLIAGTGSPVPTLVVADQVAAEQALALLRLGAADYLCRPLDLPRLVQVVDLLTARSRESGRVGTGVLATEVAAGPEGRGFDDSAEDEPLMTLVRRVAPLDVTILLDGETGTGKTWLARRIHELSPRRCGPFVAFNCNAPMSGSLEAELFGHRADTPGRLGEVGGGTLFLGEVDAIPPSLQPRLLRAVEDRSYEPGGGGPPSPFRARLIASSSRDLELEVDSGRFRADLYHRLNVIGLHLAPLRERRGTIRTMVARYIAEFSARHATRVDSIDEDALKALEAYHWPGNMRELRNAIERTVALCSERTIRPEDLPGAIAREARPPVEAQSVADQGAPESPTNTLAEIKRDAEFARITQALAKHSNNRLRAASELGISRMTLYKKLYKYGLMQPAAPARASPD